MALPTVMPESLSFALAKDRAARKRPDPGHGQGGCGREQRPPTCSVTRDPARFQSAPAITGERCGRRVFCCCSNDCFNPRPPLLASDASRVRYRDQGSLFQSTPAITGERCVSDAVIHPPYKVSIHACHYWRAMRCAYSLAAAFASFQSTPAITGERCPDIQDRRSTDRGFNPRPPLLASDALTEI